MSKSTNVTCVASPGDSADIAERGVQTTAQTLNFTSWNRTGEWLRRLDGLRRLA